VLCASDAVAEQVEWTQITLGEGPGVEAVGSGAPTIVTNAANPDDRWPTFAAEAAKAGVGALYALPLEIGAIRVGVLSLYRDRPSELDATDFADAVAVAELVTAVLLTVGRTGRLTGSLGPWWDQPLSTREVHQATGMIVAQLRVTAREAFARMQGFAHAVVHRRLRFDEDPDASPNVVVPTA
jgi:hypothetical protein